MTGCMRIIERMDAAARDIQPLGNVAAYAASTT
jgi:hypothetical protein